MKAALLDNQSITATRTDTMAYDLYLLARQKIRDRKEQPLLDAAARLRRAIKADSGFAPAFAQLGITHLLLSKANYGTLSNSEALNEAKPWIDRALELDSEQAETWAALGLYWQNTQLGSDQVKAIGPRNVHWISTPTW